jgi:hypothetical protein
MALDPKAQKELEAFAERQRQKNERKREIESIIGLPTEELGRHRRRAKQLLADEFLLSPIGRERNARFYPFDRKEPKQRDWGFFKYFKYLKFWKVFTWLWNFKI